jgi:hypothetical protein
MRETYTFRIAWALFFAAFFLAVLVGCTDTTSPEAAAPGTKVERILDSDLTDVFVVHDEKRAVTCWVARYNGRALSVSCLPDTQLAKGAR